MRLPDADTIAAVATPPGRGGVAIVRVSGPASRTIGQSLFRSGRPDFPGLTPYRLHHGTFYSPAGRLLDAAGCKGMRRGAAEVSARHANFIVNPGGATCRDGVELARRMRDAVEEKFGVVLEPEIRIWGGESPERMV